MARREDVARHVEAVRQSVANAIVGYTRTASTVIMAVVGRLCLDCIGIVATGQEPTQTTFWFAHCPYGAHDGACLLVGVILFLVAIVGGSAVAWSCQDWVMDPDRNPCARSFSFAMILEAATWIPVSVVVGKTNAAVEWFMNSASDDRVQALVSSAISAVLTLSCALLTHRYIYIYI